MRPPFLDRFLGHAPGRPALRWRGRRWTYGELRRIGERTAGWLAAQGVRPGDRVGIQLENSLDLVAAHLGCMALGAVRVPLNRHYRQAELAPILEDADLTLLLTPVPEYAPGVRTASRPGRGRALAAWAGPTDVTAVLFTSGTTGRPKGVPQTWRMWESNLDALAERWELGADDVLWLCLPCFHTHGLVVGLHGAWLRGACVRLEPQLVAAPPPAGVTHVYGVPTFYRRWLPLMRAAPARFRGVRLWVSGSDGLPADLSDELAGLLGQRVLERYGMTETVMITSNPGRGERRAGRVGTPLRDTEVRLVDGEVQVRGPGVFGGYWPRPDPTAFTADGFFRTGDLGELDADGSLALTGRSKDLVIVGGVNVSPAEVEAALAGTAGVAALGACGLPDADLGEVVGLAVVPDGTVPEAALRQALAAAAQALSGLKRPRRVAVVEALPRNALGKLQRGRIAKECFGG